MSLRNSLWTDFSHCGLSAWSPCPLKGGFCCKYLLFFCKFLTPSMSRSRFPEFVWRCGSTKLVWNNSDRCPNKRLHTSTASQIPPAFPWWFELLWGFFQMFFQLSFALPKCPLVGCSGQKDCPRLNFVARWWSSLHRDFNDAEVLEDRFRINLLFQRVSPCLPHITFLDDIGVKSLAKQTVAVKTKWVQILRCGLVFVMVFGDENKILFIIDV